MWKHTVLFHILWNISWDSILVSVLLFFFKCCNSLIDCAIQRLQVDTSLQELFWWRRKSENGRLLESQCRGIWWKHCKSLKSTKWNRIYTLSVFDIKIFIHNKRFCLHRATSPSCKVCYKLSKICTQSKSIWKFVLKIVLKYNIVLLYVYIAQLILYVIL